MEQSAGEIIYFIMGRPRRCTLTFHDFKHTHCTSAIKANSAIACT